MALRCQKQYPICSFRYIFERGAPEFGIAPGTPLEDVPQGWVCPKCAADKTKLQSPNKVLQEVSN